ncbi:MAG: hypothetical protein ACRDSF_27165 [Pseudonocardiaceae bacterium]
MEFQRDEVLTRIRGSVPFLYLPALIEKANKMGRLLDDAKANVVSILLAFLAFSDDAYLAALKGKVERLTPSPANAEVRAAFPRAFGRHMPRDAIAIGQGLHLAPHEEVRAEGGVDSAPIQGVRGADKNCAPGG